jgi:hypothetical protein
VTDTEKYFTLLRKRKNITAIKRIIVQASELRELTLRNLRGCSSENLEKWQKLEN